MPIRKGRLSDITAIAALHVQSWQECYASFLPKDFLANLDIERLKERHHRYMTGNTDYYVKIENDQYLGFASYGSPRTSSKIADIEMYTIYTKTSYLGQGIGTELLEYIIEASKAKSIIVEVFKRNPYRLFYEKHGFQKIDQAVIDLGSFQEETWIYLLELGVN